MDDSDKWNKPRDTLGRLLLLATAGISLGTLTWGGSAVYQDAKSRRALVQKIVRDLDAANGRLTIQISSEELAKLKEFVDKNPQATDQILRSAFSEALDKSR